MGLYNFQERFVPAILDGTKTHTIRAERRKHNDMPGDWMHLYTGLRHKGARLLMRRRCVMVEFIGIETDHTVWIGHRLAIDPSVRGGESVPGGRIFLDASEREALAKRDGFDSFAEMMAFWDGRLPFFGLVLHWEGI